MEAEGVVLAPHGVGSVKERLEGAFDDFRTNATMAGVRGYLFHPKPSQVSKNVHLIAKSRWPTPSRRQRSDML